MQTELKQVQAFAFNKCAGGGINSRAAVIIKSAVTIKSGERLEASKGAFGEEDASGDVDSIAH